MPHDRVHGSYNTTTGKTIPNYSVCTINNTDIQNTETHTVDQEIVVYVT